MKKMVRLLGVAAILLSSMTLAASYSQAPALGEGSGPIPLCDPRDRNCKPW